jgi:hypothetical protein
MPMPVSATRTRYAVDDARDTMMRPPAGVNREFRRVLNTCSGRLTSPAAWRQVGDS